MNTSTIQIERKRAVRRRAAAPNVVIREACDRDGIVLGHFVADHDGTPEGIDAGLTFFTLHTSGTLFGS